MKHSNLFKSIAGGALLLAVLGLAFGLNPLRTGSSEVQASLDTTHTVRPARLPIATQDDKARPTPASIQGIPTRADVREPGAEHIFARPELESLIQVIDSPGRTEPKSRPSQGREAGDASALSGNERQAPPSDAPTLVTTFAGPDFDDNPIVNGEGRIPPDPKGAVGQNHVVATVNEILEIRQKSGTLDGQTDLDTFLTNLGYTPLAFTFDPKVTYDPFEDRFVVAVLGVSDKILDGTPTDESSIFIAVSDDGNPNGTWCSTEIEAKIDLGGSVFTWADYPGLVVDEEAVYVTASLFQFASHDPSFPFGGIRLWTIDKGTNGGLYDCDTADVNLFNPYSGTGLDQQAALQPAAVAGIAPAGAGTFLIGYSGTTLDTPGDGTNSEFQQVIRVDDPLGSTTFTKDLVDLGNIENLSGAPELPNASQSGSGVAIETNDRSTLSGFWRGSSLFTAQSINPTGTVFAGNNGQATAYWVEIDTNVLNNLTLADHGVIGGEDIAAETHTFFPSISTVVGGYVAIGFAASGPNIHPGAYFTWRWSKDPAGSTRMPPIVLHAGEDVYVRTRKGDNDDNRWGDWSDIMFDPAQFGCFWVFNQYAMTQGSPTNTGNGNSVERGRWATEWGNYCITSTPILWDGFETGDTSAWSKTSP